MDSKMFSILIPTYNTEKYIEDCVNSVLNQGVDNYEIIIVDDGSTDGTKKILNNYRKDKRIKVVYNDHIGVAEIRNKLLKLAKGKYIVFLDSDDILCDGFLKELYDYALKNDFDCHIGSYNSVLDNEELAFIKEYKVDPKQINNKSKEAVLNYIHQSKCIFATGRFIFKNEIVKKSKVLFTKGIFHEDEEWVSKMLLQCNSFCSINKTQFLYRRRENSITKAPTMFNYVCKLKVAISLLNESEKYDDYRKIFLIKKANKLCKEIYYVTSELLEQKGD